MARARQLGEAIDEAHEVMEPRLTRSDLRRTRSRQCARALLIIPDHCEATEHSRLRGLTHSVQKADGDPTCSQATFDALHTKWLDDRAPILAVAQHHRRGEKAEVQRRAY